MSDTSSDHHSQSMITNRWWFHGAIITGLLLLNAMLLLIPGEMLAQGVRVFYWQRYNNYLYQLRCLFLILVLIAIVVDLFLISTGKMLEADRRAALMTWSFLLFIICLFVNYSGLFILGYVSTVGTVSFNGHVYHLAEYAKYDDPSRYYLGECDQNGYWCIFQEIYQTFMVDPGAPEIIVSNDSQLILIKMGSSTVYTYDGKAGYCMEDAALGWCSESPP